MVEHALIVMAFGRKICGLSGSRVKLASVLLGLLLNCWVPNGAVAGDAAEAPLTSLLPEAIPFSEYFYAGQAVYDGQGNEIGDVNDVLLDTKGSVTAVIVGLGGLLGAGEKNVAVSFRALKMAEKDFKPHLILDMPKGKLELAPGFEFDRAKRRWVPAAAGKAEEK